jgi:arylsulfatase A-like enzyme
MNMRRRDFLGAAGTAGLGFLAGCKAVKAGAKRPNVVYVFADQWRASAMGYSGDPNVKTPHLDALAAESFNFRNAVSCCPVCSPARASMITGQYPLTHGVFVNDVCLGHNAPSIADQFNAAGYRTGYIGKWHLDGHGRSIYIPEERRQGFKSWQALECTHNYNQSAYYDDNDPEIKMWDGYDAFGQTGRAIRFIEESGENPFMLFLSWGPPHAPYLTAPEKFRKLYDPATLKLPPNIPESSKFIPASQWDEHGTLDPVERTRQIMAGYYAHCSALDGCIGLLQAAIRRAGLEANTIFVFTSDHGDMLGSHGLWKKQWPYDESACVPFLLKAPQVSRAGCEVETPINTPDIMPTLCDLCGVPVPESVQGRSLAPAMASDVWPKDEAALIANYHPFGQWSAGRGGKEWRGVRTARYSYIKDLNGSWLLFDNQTDPYQMDNLVNRPEHAALQRKMESRLRQKLEQTGDSFSGGMDYVRQWGYPVDETGTVPYTP